MTDETKKAAAGWSLGTIVAALLAFGPAWPVTKDVLDYLGPIFAREQVQAAMAGMGMALALVLALPHALPGHWEPEKTNAWRFRLCVIAAGATSYALVHTRTGLVYAVLAGLAAPTVARAVSGGLYKLFPGMKPKSLQP